MPVGWEGWALAGCAGAVLLLGLIAFIGWGLQQRAHVPHKGPPPVVDARTLSDAQLRALIAALATEARQRGLSPER